MSLRGCVYVYQSLLIQLLICSFVLLFIRKHTRNVCKSCLKRDDIQYALILMGLSFYIVSKCVS